MTRLFSVCGAIVIALALLVLGGLGWAALAPLETTSQEVLFEIPAGTAARRIAGEKELEILPRTIRLEGGNVLALRNSDAAPHIFGPTLIMPGQTFRLPFTKPATYSFLCTAHADGQLAIVVAPAPKAGWERLRRRWQSLTDSA